MLRSWFTGQDVEGLRNRPQRTAGAIPAQRLADFVDVGAVLERERQDDRGVTRVGVALIPGFVIVKEKLANGAVCKAANAGGEAQAAEFEAE
jgi:hypothetical protein